uniref:Putative membrane-associated ring finger n=1 Tax=Rhipicephalus microplus TaxID=6941 RepID=A0A6M2D1Z3_RHIMP
MWHNVPVDMANGYHNGAGSSGTTCRICQEGDQKAQLVSPCSCSGTIGFVHVSCLERWLNERDVDYCELCGERFQMAAQPISALRFFCWAWRNKRWLWRSLLIELLGFFIVIPIAVCVFYVLTILALRSHGFHWYIIIVYFLSIVALIVYVVNILKKLPTRYRVYLG